MSWFNMLGAFSVVTFIILHVSAQQANITISPNSTNVLRNGVAEFSCTAVASVFIWKANGTEINDGGDISILKPITVAQNTLMSILRVGVSSVSNGTNITCEVIRDNPLTSDKSDPALLLVQGLLESVDDLIVSRINSTTVLISWSPPFTLEGVPILGYNVTISNRRENETTSVDLEEPMLYHTIGSSKGNFTVTVVPTNGLGAGAATSIVYIAVFPSSTSTTTTTKAIVTITPSASTGNPSILAEAFGGTLAAVFAVFFAIILFVSIALYIFWSRTHHGTTKNSPDIETSTPLKPLTRSEILAHQGTPSNNSQPDLIDSYSQSDEKFETLDHIEAERRLEHSTHGEYLVRKSPEQEKYALAVKWNDGIVHCLIHTVPDPESHSRNLYYIDVLEDLKLTLRFTEVDDLIKYMVKSQVPFAGELEAKLSSPAPSHDKWKLNRNDIELDGIISYSGQFGVVYEGTILSRREKVAIKTCKSSKPDPDKRQFHRGIEILKQCDHPNIVRLIGIADEKFRILVVTEIMPAGTFLKYLRKKGASFSNNELIEMGLQVCTGMTYLEKKNIVHRILGAQNCLVKEEGHVVVKIANVGMSREKNETYKSFETPIKWTAPEALNSGKYTSASDVWSMGILLWEIFSPGSAPYSHVKNDYEALKWVEAGNRMCSPDGCPKSLYDVMLKCWNIDENQRPTFAKLCTELDELCKSPNYKDSV